MIEYERKFPYMIANVNTLTNCWSKLYETQINKKYETVNMPTLRLISANVYVNINQV